MTEIAPCPCCGGECFMHNRPMSLDDLSRESCFLECNECGYESGRYEGKAEAIAAHNALCADVTLARNLRSALGVHLAMRISDNAGGTLPRFEVQAFENVPPDGGGSIVYRRDTLDAALDELAKKIGGSDEAL